ncbi:MAG: hypothetical protein ACOYIE_06270 [Agathobaculum sp.]|jgi:6-phosphogluconolactonase/glucosamine-6-phosphate isomerase/deaminase|uniref:hypothetical protein n=1 Tax=Agathobaculum sp. TaxID=2048138 RepID=UPI003D8D55CB
MLQRSKRLLAAIMAAALTLTLCACGEKKAQQAEGALSEQEYIDAVDTLNIEMYKLQTAAQENEITDEQAAQALVDELKQPMLDFAALVPPAAYAEAHEKLSSGCQAMADYMDIILAAAGETEDDVLRQAAEDANDKLMTAMNDLSEGSLLLGEAME